MSIICRIARIIALMIFLAVTALLLVVPFPLNSSDVFMGLMGVVGLTGSNTIIWIDECVVDFLHDLPRREARQRYVIGVITCGVLWLALFALLLGFGLINVSSLMTMGFLLVLCGLSCWFAHDSWR